jgi:hypothetical protein
MTTKPTVVCPKCHEPIDLEHGGGRCAKCGTELRAAEQPGVGTPGPERPKEAG